MYVYVKNGICKSDEGARNSDQNKGRGERKECERVHSIRCESVTHAKMK